jgi:hypothetical protein
MLAPEDSHHWSGWPGAVCLKCHNEDPMEIAIADNTFDPWNGTWATEELQAQYLLDATCPVKGTLTWDTSRKRWKLTGA